MLYNEPSPLEVKVLTRRFGLENSLGAWEIVNGILADDLDYLNQMARALYGAMNGRLEVSLEGGLMHCLDIGDVTLLKHHTDPSHWVSSDDGVFTLGESSLNGPDTLA